MPLGYWIGHSIRDGERFLDLLHGRLVIPIDISSSLENTYWIVHPKLTSREAKILALRDWFLAEAADEERRLRTQIKRCFRGTRYASTKRQDLLLRSTSECFCFFRFVLRAAVPRLHPQGRAR